LARFFFRFVSVWVRFSFFGFRLIKSNWTGRFFLILISLIEFFSRFGFFGYCFSDFPDLIGFLIFLLTPNFYYLLDK
jgi:hypothetical protein